MARGEAAIALSSLKQASAYARLGGEMMSKPPAAKASPTPPSSRLPDLGIVLTEPAFLARSSPRTIAILHGIAWNAKDVRSCPGDPIPETIFATALLVTSHRRCLLDLDITTPLYLLRVTGRQAAICRSEYLRDTDRFLYTRPLTHGFVEALLVPACASISRVQLRSNSSIVVVGRSREELGHLAFRKLRSVLPFPLHPSWEEPLMDHLVAVGAMEIHENEGAIASASLALSYVQEEVSNLWREGKLPSPSPA